MERAIDILDAVELGMQQKDGPVWLESIQVKALVQKLDVMCADILIGTDLVVLVDGLELS